MLIPEPLPERKVRRKAEGDIAVLEKNDNIGIDRCGGMLQILLSILIAMLIPKIPKLLQTSTKIPN
jgi:hypothetical protein